MRALSRQHRKFQALLAERASGMRHHATSSEQKLWQSIAGGKLGVVFRRQVPLGRYIADFVAPAAKLIIEVDGKCHSRRVAADARRDRYLSRLGYRVLRLDAILVMREPEVAVARIRAALTSLESPLSV